jgi:hypothetical protein
VQAATTCSKWGVQAVMHGDLKHVVTGAQRLRLHYYSLELSLPEYLFSVF